MPASNGRRSSRLRGVSGPMRCSISIRRSSNSKERSTWHWMSSPGVSAAPIMTRLSISVLAKVAEKTRLGDFDGGAQAVDEALIDLDRREAEQR
jgi:hypothetical protein